MTEQLLSDECMEAIQDYINSNSYYTSDEDGNNGPNDLAMETAYESLSNPEIYTLAGLRKCRPIPSDYKDITGHDSMEEMHAYEEGREHEQTTIYNFIKNWDGSDNSVMGEILKDKLTGVLYDLMNKHHDKFFQYLLLIATRVLVNNELDEAELKQSNDYNGKRYRIQASLNLSEIAEATQG